MDAHLTLNELLDKYSDLFDVEKFKQSLHHTKHYIRTQGPAVCGQVRRLSPKQQAILKRELPKLLDLEIIVPFGGDDGFQFIWYPRRSRRRIESLGTFKC